MSARYVINSGVVALTGTTAKTLANIINSATGMIRLVEFGVTTDGVTTTAVPARLDLCTSTQATAGTAGGSTIAQIGGRTRTVQATAGYAYTVEPTVLTVVKSWYIPQLMGSLIIQSPLGREYEFTDASDGLCLRLTPSATVNALCYMEFEEG